MSTLALPTNNSNPAQSSTPSQSTLALPLPLSLQPAAGPSNSSRRQSLALPGMAKTPSPEPEDDDDEEDEEGEKKRKKKKSGAVGSTGNGVPAASASGNGAVSGGGGSGEGKGEYKYSSEISQMMFVFGEVQDPLPETVRLVEDVVRGQIIEIVTRARLLTHLRSSRYLSAEDLIFLIRDDRGKVNRLRTYLSWKDVRKRAKEDEEGGGDVDVEEADKATAPKGRKSMVKLPWELLTPFSDFLRGLPSNAAGGGVGKEDEEEEDEDEMQAYQDSMQRLKDADEITKKMTKDEYVHYSDCRQASFTYRKARRFREFINFSAYLDVRPNDDIIDILGFLSFEMVRSLCVTALDVRDRLEKFTQPTIPLPTRKSKSVLPAANSTGAGAAAASQGAGQGGLGTSNGTAAISPVKRKSIVLLDSPSKKFKSDLVASPEPTTPNLPGSAGAGERKHHHNSHVAPVSLFAPPPSARQPLLPAHVLEAFAQIQREQAANRVGGMKNWRGGVMGRGKVALV